MTSFPMGSPRSGDGMFDHMAGWDGGWMWLWGSLMMLTWVVIIAGVAWFILRSRDHSAAVGKSHAAEILDERYARGEIDVEEYHERLEHLR
ncbi:MAG: SHOCT domain-containing protein [Microthrixaceae bacterium]|nr:SHOCT domain-containing protein [Microthrixaceae bacterium]